jgi:ABC-2 type transport system permease protein
VTTLAYAASDSGVMLRRVLRHSVRNPTTVIMAFAMPVLMLLLLTYAFGGAMQTHGVKYIDYVLPGIILLTAANAASAVAVAVATDMQQGIIDRFRTMAIARSSVLTGHVLGSALRTLVAVAMVTAVGLAIGFRPHAGALAWLAATGLVALVLLAIGWLAAAFGIAANNPEGAVSSTIVLLLLPYLSSAFVPTDTMPGWLQVFTAHQPMTPIAHALRGLLMGTPIGNDGWIAAVWGAGLALVGYRWAGSAFRRRAPR